jgi:hypothetical protein
MKWETFEMLDEIIAAERERQREIERRIEHAEKKRMVCDIIFTSSIAILLGGVIWVLVKLAAI